MGRYLLEPHRPRDGGSGLGGEDLGQCPEVELLEAGAAENQVYFDMFKHTSRMTSFSLCT